MNPRGITTSQVHAALEREPRIHIHRHPIRIDSADGTVTLEGEVADVAAKKLALEAAVPSEREKRRAELDAWSLFAVKGVVNRLRVSR